MGAAMMTCAICTDVIDPTHEHYELEAIRDPYRDGPVCNYLFQKRMLVCGRCWRKRRFLLWGEWFNVERNDESWWRKNPDADGGNTTVATTQASQSASTYRGPATRHRLGESAGP